MSKWFEIINPSDKAFISAEDPAVAAFAVLHLGGGSYGLRGPEGDTILPILLFGGYDQWAEAWQITDDWVVAHKRDIGLALATVVLASSAEDAQAHQDSLTGLNAVELAARWEERADSASSLNNLMRSANSLMTEILEGAR